MRVTKVATTQQCAVCERTLLMGERAASFAPSEGAELVDVCPLCQEVAVEAGWIKEGTPTTPTLVGERRRKRGLVEFLGLTRATDDGALARQEPILRKLSDNEVALLEAADLFNGSAYRRTVGGIAKSLGEPQASIVPGFSSATTLVKSSTVAVDWPFTERITSPATSPAFAAGPLAATL